MNFMRDSIPDGYYVVVKNFTLYPGDFPAFPVAYAADWAADEALYGPGQSLYHYLRNAGFAGIDSFYRARPFGLVYRKNDPSFTPKWMVGEGVYDTRPYQWIVHHPIRWDIFIPRYLAVPKRGNSYSGEGL